MIISILITLYLVILSFNFDGNLKHNIIPTTTNTTFSFIKNIVVPSIIFELNIFFIKGMISTPIKNIYPNKTLIIT